MAVGIWREGLHQFLWERTYGDNLVQINQQDLAADLAVTKHTMNRVIKAMVEEGRLEPHGEQTYRVIDPDKLLVDAD